MISYLSKHMAKVFIAILLMGVLNLLVLIGFFYIEGKEYDGPLALGSKLLEEDDLGQWAAYLKDRQIWCFLLNKDGQVIESINLPKDIKTSYDIRDIARFTRFYLEDYPVFTFVKGDGLLVLGYPKGSYDKFGTNYVKTSVFYSLLKLLFGLLCFNLLAVVAFYLRIRKRLYEDMVPIQQSIEALAQNQPVSLSSSGELKEIKDALNRSARKMEDINTSRNRWIRGISHDIRTPLSKMIWALEQMPADDSNDKIHKYIEEIDQTLNNLNLTMALETGGNIDFQPSRIVPLVRQIVVDYANRHPDIEFDFYYELSRESYLINEHLIKRAVENLLLNAIEHGKACKISTSIYEKKRQLLIEVKDNGQIDEETLQRLQGAFPLSEDRNGLGTTVVKQIAEVHGGYVDFCRDIGLKASMVLPIKSPFGNLGKDRPIST